MPDDTQQYRKLPGLGLEFIGLSRLHAARDHLLLATSIGIVQSYKRFYFRDIQAITIRKTATWAVANVVLAILTCPSVLLAVVYFAGGGDNDSETALAWAVFAMLFGVPLVFNLALGPTCICHIRTAVQTERIAPMGRLRRAQTTLETLRPLIIEAQGHLAAEEIPQRMEAIASGHVPYDAMMPPVIGLPASSPPAAGH